MILWSNSGMAAIADYSNFPRLSSSERQTVWRSQACVPHTHIPLPSLLLSYPLHVQSHINYTPKIHNSISPLVCISKGASVHGHVYYMEKKEGTCMAWYNTGITAVRLHQQKSEVPGSANHRIHKYHRF